MANGLAKREEVEAGRLRKVLPDRLTQALRDSGLSRRALSEIIGVHLNTVHAYASGQRFPRLSQLTLLAKALRVSLDWLLDLSGTAEMVSELRPRDLEILEYVQLENHRGHHPTFVEISHAFDADPYWASPYVRKLVRFGLLAPQPGFRITKAGLKAIPPDAVWRPRKKLPKRTPVLAIPRPPRRESIKRTPVV